MGEMHCPDYLKTRNRWISLDGDWLLNGTRIKVPFCPESRTSEFLGEIDYTKEYSFVYEKCFDLPEFMRENENARIILHLDGVDQEYVLVLNDKIIGAHSDGYTRAEFDITNAVRKSNENLLKVIVSDTLSTEFPYGKQKLKRGGMWYTPFSGIWKSVWLEEVPEKYIGDLTIKANPESVTVSFNFSDFLEKEVRIRIYAPVIKHAEFGAIINEQDTEEEYWTVFYDINNIPENDLRIPLHDIVSNLGNPIPVKLWDTENPWIYDMEIEAGEDRIKTYFAIRTIEIKLINGILRVCLNDKPIFLHGVLDQGYFTESVCLPGDAREYERDILRMKELGFNMLRKHIKTEPDCYYYYADIHGMLIMQDMVNSGKYRYIKDTVLPTIGIKFSIEKLRHATKKRRMNFEKHINGVVRDLRNHPSIICYTIFNEGWGEHESGYYYDLLKKLDDTRLIDTASGWFKPGKTDFDSRHIYFRLRNIKKNGSYHGKPIFVTECGGYSYAVTGHMYKEDASYGYGTCKSIEELTDKIEELYKKMIMPGIKASVCGCVYTQLSDVEDEINGLYTFDREVCKVDKERMIKLSKELTGEKWFV